MENNLAVLIDFENIAAGTEKEGLGRFDVDALMQRIKDKGRILLSRSYADWGRFSRFKQSLLAANVTMMELTSHGMQDKNRADIAMVVDALELAFTKDYIHTFVVVSGDSDFTPLVLKMRELNKRVIGCGTRKSTSRLLVQACDEFLFYDSIIGKSTARGGSRVRRAPKTGEPMTRETAFARVEDAIVGLQRENPDPPLASVVKSAMLRKSPDFSESDLGFSSFARFLEAAQTAGHVKIVRDRKSGGYRVDLLEDGNGEAGADAKEQLDDWEDPYIPDGAEDFVEHLASRGLHPLGAPTRKALLEALEQVATERRKRRRKATIHFVKDDIKKKLRRTHPDLPVEHIRGILDALMKGGLLMHRDGTAIRSPSAPFRLEKDATELNEALATVFLSEILDGGPEIDDVSVLAELLHGDPERRRDVEEALAWIATERATSDDDAPGDDEPPADLDLDLDLLLEPSEPADTGASKPEPAPAGDDAPAAEEAEATAPAEDASAAEAAPESPPAEAKPKRKRLRRKKVVRAAAPAESESESESESAPEPAPAEPAPAADLDLADLDDLLAAD